MKNDIKETIKIPDGIQVDCKDNLVSIKGPKGELSRNFLYKKVRIKVEGGLIVFESVKATKREKRMMWSIIAHIENMIKGVQEPYVYKLKVCSSHFPMTAEIKDNILHIKNYLGEGTSRKTKISKDVNVKVEGGVITVESSDKELAGMTASAIEESCKIFDKDRRIFQDGVFITEKPGKEIK